MYHDLDTEVRQTTRDTVLLRRIVGLLAPYRWKICLALAFLPAIALVQLSQPYLLKLAIDRVLLPGDLGHLGTLVMLYVASLGVEGVLRFGHSYSTQYAGQLFMFDLRQTLYERLLAHSPSFHDKNPPGRMMTRVTNDVESLNALFTSGVVAVAADSVQLLAIGGMLLWLDWRLALCCFGMLPPLVPVLLYFRRKMREVFRLTKVLLSRMNAYLAEVVAGIRVVQLFGREARCAAEFGESNDAFRNAYHRSNLYEAALFSVVELASRVAVAGLLWFGGCSILAARMSFGTLVAAVEYTNHLFTPIRDLSAKFAILQSAMASAERIFQILDAPVELTWRPAAAPQAVSSGAVEFDRVTFSYRPGEPVLEELSLSIAAGEHVAIVGATGAGKTTVMKLLARFYDPQQGAVRVDGLDLRELDAATLHRALNVVLQDVFIFSGTVAENISLGDSSISRERIEEAARAVRADRFVAHMPRGYDSALHERGSNLSIGERQLLSFARALVLDPRILVLDEATSSVDSETEGLVQEALAKVMRGRTTIVIAHRLSTIRDANRILVLHRGRLAEQGSHEQLLKLGGVYRRLYELQYADQETRPSAAAGEPSMAATTG